MGEVVTAPNVTGQNLLNMIESLIAHGATVRLGTRRVHVVSEHDGGFVKLAITRRDWDGYAALGRRMPATIIEGLR